MARSHTILSTAAGLTLAAAMLTGCGNATAPKTAADATPSETPTKVITANTRACAGVQGVIGHLASDTVHWSPTQKPFDKDIAGRIKLLAGELDVQAKQADSKRIDAAVHLSARAFSNVSTAMTSRKRSAVNAAIHDSKVAYKVLKSACSLE